VTTIRTGLLTDLGEELLKKRTTLGTRDSVLERKVKDILDRVRVEGDKALLDFTRMFDGADLSSKGLRVSEPDIAEARNKVTPNDLRALEYLRKRIARIEKRKLDAVNYVYDDGKIRLRQVTRPLRSVGCYVPGGRAAYPSTVLMTVVPAKVAGVPRIVMCSPPSGDGEIEPMVLVAADLCGADEVYRVGGAQAIAAMAYGTETIQPVDKIVGPGSEFVTVAKRMVNDVVAIDLPAGPSEILVLADDSADIRCVVLDLISQAEHAPDNIPILVTTSRRVLEETSRQIEELLTTLERREIAEEALGRQGALLLADSMDDALDFVNRFGPEHLEILTHSPRLLAEKVTAAGIILVGEYTPVAASDYCLGTNHVLPTMGFAQTYSGLSVLDYVKMIPVVECRRSTLKTMLRPAKTLSEREGLPNHYLALAGRFGDD